jgi:hypothetical protein
MVVALGLALAMTWRAQSARRGGDGLAQAVATRWARETIDARARALDAAAVRLAGLEARPPEVFERTLFALAQSDPAIALAWACAPDGRIIAAVDARAGLLRQEPGGLDPRPERRAALGARISPGAPPSTYRAAAHQRVDLGVARPEAGFYLAAELRTGPFLDALASLSLTYDQPLRFDERAETVVVGERGGAQALAVSVAVFLAMLAALSGFAVLVVKRRNP